METVPLTGAARDREIGGVPASELAAIYGTPLHLIDVDELELEIDAFDRAFVQRGIRVAYAGKAFLCSALAELLAPTPLWLDVCSLGELQTAERGGFPAARTYFHGCGKSGAELAAIADGRVAFSVVDSRDELERLAAHVSPGASVDIMLRVNTGIDAHTHEYVRTSGENTKFGIIPAQLEAVFARVRELSHVRLIGLHSHVGSGIVDIAPLVDNLDVLLDLMERARAHGLAPTEIIAGGGLGIEAAPGLPRPLDYDALAEALLARTARTPYRVAIEPGRALIARAGTSLYSVMAVKEQAGRRFVIVDGGMADNPRPALYDAFHRCDVMTSQAHEEDSPATLCGRSCENDELGETSLPRDLRAGELVALRTTGAYTYSMASNYNRFGRPPVIFVRNGSHRRVIRGESADDVLRNDL